MHKPYHEVFGHSADFKIRYQFYSIAEENYITLLQGCKFNFKYAEKWAKNNDVFMIWPEFEDENGNIIIDNENTYVGMVGTARMWIFSNEWRKLHQQRIRIGTKGYFVEGNKKVAECEVIEILGLMNNPTAQNRKI